VKGVGLPGALAAVTLAAALAALFVGPFPASPGEVLRVIASRLVHGPRGSAALALETAILQVRLPRVALALLVGMALACSGVAYQSVFQNPLVSAHILGVASGASFGAAAAITASAGPVVVQLSAFCGGLLAVAVVLAAVRLFPASSSLHMVLMGIVASSFFSALVSLLIYFAAPDQEMSAIVFWLMGSLSAASPATLAMTLPVILFGLALLLALRWRLNVLSMGDEDAQVLGVHVGRTRLAVVLCCTLVTAAAVCAAGVIGWVGLVIPHLGRILAGADHRRLLPTAILLGGLFLLLVDGAARTLSTAEIPLGILTGLVGAPVFAMLLYRSAGQA
jgi:iron complex transport system permease protein